MSHNAFAPQDTPVAIAGAGLLGRLLAWRLLQAGYPVSLFEQGSFERPQSAAHTAAAMISPLSEVVVSERSIYDMGVQSLALWPLWLEQLAAHAPPVAYKAGGSLVVAHRHDEAELLQFERDLQFHLGPDNPAQWLDGDGIARLEPDLAGRFERALFLPDEAHLDNRGLLVSLLAAIRALGGRCHEGVLVDFIPHAHCASHRLDEFAWVFDCRGMGARQALPGLRGVRGEVLWVRTNEVTLNHAIRLMHPRYKLYVVPKPDQQFIIGATEIESEDRSPVTVQSMLELCSALYTLNPAFAEARIYELDANLRPSLPSNLPLVSDVLLPLACGQHQRTVNVNGLYRHGYLLAPFLVNHLLTHIHQQLPLDL